MKHIVINKNRGWRGLAEIQFIDNETITKMLFSFSQPVWEDMLKGIMIMQDPHNYILLKFSDTTLLPKGQRSVLIKNFNANIDEVFTYPKNEWSQLALSHGHYEYIAHFIKNRNNHTTSDWNCLGIRVTPMI